jgi:hypothetical protein
MPASDALRVQVGPVRDDLPRATQRAVAKTAGTRDFSDLSSIAAVMSRASISGDMSPSPGRTSRSVRFN